MLISRWQAPITPDKIQILSMFEAEGLSPYEEELDPETLIEDIRHPFDEVRMVAAGELHLNVNGNQLLLRAGDKIVIPSNTKYSKKSGPSACLSICAKKSY